MSFATIEQLLALGRLDEAQVECQAAIQVQPTNPKLHAYLGMCYFRRSEWLPASESFRRATALDPGFWQAGCKLAQCLDRMRRYDEALAVAKEFAHVQPNDNTLQGLVVLLSDLAKGDRKDGWERTSHLAHKVKFSGDA